MGTVTEFRKPCGKELPSDLKAEHRTQLDDATSAFYFSRLPREERIATILANVLFSKMPTWPLTSYEVTLTGPINLMDIGKELASYAEKDFAVRYGKL